MTRDIKRDEVDRWTGNAITNVSPNTPEQQAVIDELNTEFDTAAYIIADMEQQNPGCTTNTPREKVEQDVLQFMRNHGIITVSDYEKFFSKDQQTK